MPKEQMKTGLLVFLFLLSTVTFAQNVPVRMTRVSADTFRVGNVSFLRVAAKPAHALQIQFNGTIFFLADKAGNPQPFDGSQLEVTVNISGVFVENRLANSAVITSQVYLFMQNALQGTDFYIDIPELLDTKGQQVTLKHEPMVLRKL